MRIVSGKNPVREILKTEKVNKIYISKNLRGKSKNEFEKLADKANIKKVYIDEKKLDEITQARVHQGIAVEAEDFNYSDIDELLEVAKLKDEKPFLIILDKITDVNNLGAIIRSAEGSGAHGIVIPKHRSAKINETVAKTSAGALEFIKVAQVTNISQTIEKLKDKGFWIYGADMNGDKPYYKDEYDTPLALVIGSEGLGISRLVKEKCDIILEIPMKGRINSLNASSAAAILMFEIMKKREFHD